MMLTIYYNLERTSKQVINMSEKVFEKKTKQDIENMCRNIAHDLSNGTYSAIKID